MNTAEKLRKQVDQVRIGGKGTARRKKKVVHRTSASDDKKLQTVLKKLGVNTIQGIEEVLHLSQFTCRCFHEWAHAVLVRKSKKSPT